MAEKTVRVVLDMQIAQYQQNARRAAADTRQLGVEGDKAGKQIGQSAQKAGRDIEGSFSGVGGKMREWLGVGVVLAGLNMVTKGAADLEQAIGGTETVFRENADSMREWAQEAAQTAGLSEEAALTIANRLGGALKGYGFSVDEAAAKSKELVQLGADLAATYGGTTEEAMVGISAALRGEYDSIERWVQGLSAAAIENKALEMGLVSSKSELDQNTKAQAALALIAEKAGDAQGQFAREVDSAAGSAQIARAEFDNAAASLGTSLIPIMATGAQAGGDLADAFANMDERVQLMVASIGGLIIMGKLGPMAEGLGTGLRSIQEFFAPATTEEIGKVTSHLSGPLPAGTNRTADSMERASSSTSRFATSIGKLAGFAGGIFVLGEALKAAGAAAVDFGSGDSERYLASLRAATEEGLDGKLEEDIGGVRDALDLMGRQNDFGDALNPLGARSQEGALEEARDKVEDLDQALKSMFSENPEQAGLAYQVVLDSLGISADEGADHFDAYAGAVEDAGLQQQGAATAAGDNADATTEAGEAAEGATSKTETYAEKVQRQAEAYDDATRAALDLYAATANLLGLTIGEEEAGIRVTQAQRKLDETNADPEATDEDKRLAQLGLLSAIDDAAAASVRAAEGVAELEGKQLTASQKATIHKEKLQELAGTLAPGSDLRNNLDAVIWQLGVLSSQDDIVIRLTTQYGLDQGQLQQYLANGGDPASLERFLQDPFGVPRAMGGPLASRSVYEVFDTNNPEIAELGGKAYFFTGANSGAMRPLTDGPPAMDYERFGRAVGRHANPRGAPTFHITETTSPRRTAAEIVRKARAAGI